MAFVGTCRDMCPKRERQNRVGRSVSIFERDQNNQPAEYAMIKEYRRSGADQEEPPPDDLRTIEALERTLEYLVCNIMDDARSATQELALDWYDFLWDRLRAIRKDITQQNICDSRSAILVERCARFHVHSCYALNGVKDFDVDMNKRNLNDCLQMLRQMYHDLKTTTGTICQGELEFQLYDILLHLDDDHLSSTVMMKYSDYRSSSRMRFTTRLFNAYTNKDYYKFFQLMRQADYMTSCILSLYANKMRLIGMRTIISACATRQAVLYPAELLMKTLLFDDLDDLTRFVEALDVEIQTKDDKQYLVLSRDNLPLPSEELKPFKSRCLVEEKMSGQPVGQVVFGESIEYLPARITPPDQWSTIATPHDIAPMDEQDDYQEPESLAEDEVMSGVETNSEHEVDVAQEMPILYETPVVEDQALKNIELHIAPIRKDSPPKPQKSSPVKPIYPAIEAMIPTEPPEEVVHDGSIDLASPASSNQVDQYPAITITPDLTPVEDSEENKVAESVPEDESTDVIESSPEPENTITTLWDRRPAGTIEREQVAKLMPAGFFKVRSLSKAQPTLRLPPQVPNADLAPLRRFKPINSPQKRLSSISRSIEDEKEANKIFMQIAEMFTND